MDIFQIAIRSMLDEKNKPKPRKVLTAAETELVRVIRAENAEILRGKSRDEDWRISANCRAIRRILGPDNNG